MLSRSRPSSIDVSKIRAKTESDRLLLVAAIEGNVEYLESVRSSNGAENLRTTLCSSGCSLLHWAAGSNQLRVLEYLTIGKNIDDSDGIIFHDLNIPVSKKFKKSYGRTSLHYASRNGNLEAVKWLCEHGAVPTMKAKQGVTPFQLAVWQNHLDVCQYLVQHGNINAHEDFNDFGCGAVHWIGIAPVSRANSIMNDTSACTIQRKDNKDEDDYNDCDDDGRDLLPLVRWLASQPGMNFFAKQRQGHTALHKAAWGGHIALVKYLREEIGMFDDFPDDAGNYAASLATMANTDRHNRIALYLRTFCSRKKYESLKILGLIDDDDYCGDKIDQQSTAVTRKSINFIVDKNKIRKAYLKRARILHPDRDNVPEGHSNAESGDNAAKYDTTFHELYKAYIHLTEEDGIGDQYNPAHSLNLMLRYVNNVVPDSVRKSNSHRCITKNENIRHDNIVENSHDGNDDSSFFKARLLAVLLEYGDKGIDLSNVKKKWKQVWPKIPFPSQYQIIEKKKNDNKKDSDFDADVDVNEENRQQQRKMMNDNSNKRLIPLADFLVQKAGDVIRLERVGRKDRRVIVHVAKHQHGFNSKEDILRGTPKV